MSNQLSEREAAIRAKILSGLSREQAEEVINAQVAHDQALDAAAEEAKPKKPKSDGKKPEDTDKK